MDKHRIIGMARNARESLQELEQLITDEWFEKHKNYTSLGIITDELEDLEWRTDCMVDRFAKIEMCEKGIVQVEAQRLKRDKPEQIN